MRFMKNPNGPTGRVTEPSAQGLWGDPKVLDGRTTHLQPPDNQVHDLTALQSPRRQTQAASNRKTRDYHRFRHAGNKFRCGAGSKAMKSKQNEWALVRNCTLACLRISLLSATWLFAPDDDRLSFLLFIYKFKIVVVVKAMLFC